METDSANPVSDMQYWMENNLMVAVEMITYNHGKYIRQAIESVMAQQTDFPFRLYIFEDCSTDDTAKICTEYKEKYPERIHLHLNQRNLGVTENARLLHAAGAQSGSKYVAILEGDDYWTNPLKLQKQVDFLEQNEKYSICFHRVYEQQGKNLRLTNFNPEEDRTYDIFDLARGNCIQTVSVVFRNILNDLPIWFSKAAAGDYVLNMLGAHHGLIKYFAEPMGVYRIHSGGFWSQTSRVEILEKWRILLSHLLTWEFSQEVKEVLNKQRRKNNTEYLKLLLLNDRSVFKAKLAEFIAEDPALGSEWLMDHYLEYIASIENSRSFRLAKRLSGLKHKLTPRF